VVPSGAEVFFFSNYDGEGNASYIWNDFQSIQAAVSGLNIFLITKPMGIIGYP